MVTTMKHKALQTAIANTGAEVLLLEDYSSFYGNWRAALQLGERTLEIVSDRRDGWLSLWLLHAGKGQKLQEIESTGLSQEQELAEISRWLQSDF